MRKLYFSSFLAIILSLVSVQQAKAATTYYYVGAGAAVTLLSSWNTNSLAAAATAGSPTAFNGSGNTWNFFNAGSLSLSASWTVASNAIVNFGDGTNGLNFTIASGGTVGVNSSVPKIVVNNACTLTLNNPDNFNSSTAKTVFNTGSTIVYGTGSGIPNQFNSPFYNLIISNALTLGGSTYNVSNNMIVNSAIDLAFSTFSVTGNLTLNANATLDGGGFYVGGQLLGSSSFVGDISGSSFVTLTGTGNVGTLNLASPFQLSGLTISLGSASSSVALNNNLTIDGIGLTMTSGILNLNGKVLTLDNTTGSTAAIFGGSVSAGTSAAAIAITATTVSGSLNMVSSSNTLNYLFLNTPGSLSLGSALDIADSISVPTGTIATGGNLTLPASSALRARVGLIGTTGSISGNATVQTFAPGPNTGWALLGANVTGNTIGSWQGQFPITCTGCIYDPSSLSPHFFSVQGYNEADPTFYRYDTTVTFATPLTPGEGFWVYLGTGAAITSDITYANSGTLVQQQVSRPISFHSSGGVSSDDAYNLLANPYASPISVTRLMDFMSQQNNDWAERGVHVWNADTGLDTPLSDGDILPAGQGFFVQALSSFTDPYLATVVFDESMKTANNTGGSTTLQRTSAVAQSTVSGFKLTVHGSNGDADKTAFRFNPAATTGFDRNYDMHKMFRSPGYMGTASVWDHYTTISSISPNNKYSINNLPVLTSSLSVPVLVRVSATGTYSISVEDVQNYNSCTLLKDNLTGTYHDLSLSPYVCTINDTTSAPRFELVLCASSAPVSVKELNGGSNDIFVIQDEQGAFVSTHFAQNTKASISVFNIVGQQLVSDVKVEGTDTKTYLNLNSHNEVLFVRITTDKETVTKKIVTH